MNTAEEALAGAMDIIAEMIADDPDMTEAVRNLTYQTGLISTEAVDPEERPSTTCIMARQKPSVRFQITECWP